MEVGQIVKLFVKVHHRYFTGLDLIDRNRVLYMVNEYESDHIGNIKEGDCLLIEARVCDGSMFPNRMCLDMVNVLENKGQLR